MKRSIPSIFDLSEGPQGILRMPFIPIDYGANGGIMRRCYECGDHQRQGEMKELGSKEENERTYTDNQKWFSSSIFFCFRCWQTSEYSNAANWTA